MFFVSLIPCIPVYIPQLNCVAFEQVTVSWNEYLDFLRHDNGNLSAFWMSYVDIVGAILLGLLGTHYLISGGGGGLEFLLLANFFFYLRWKTSFFWAINVRQFSYMLCRRNLLSYAFPNLYVTILCFSWSTYFSSISTTNFFFLLTFSTNFFLTFVATNYFFQF